MYIWKKEIDFLSILEFVVVNLATLRPRYRIVKVHIILMTHIKISQLLNSFNQERMQLSNQSLEVKSWSVRFRISSHLYPNMKA